MSMPGFAAEASLAPARFHYAGAAVGGGSGEVVPSITPVACVAACVALGVDLRGTGTALGPGDFEAITAACAEVCGVAYSPALLSAVIASLTGTGGGAAGGAVAGGFTIGVLPGLLIAGAIGIPLGAGIGLGLEYAFTPDVPVTTAPPSCRPAGNTLTTGTTTGCYFGCSRSLNKTLIQAEDICRSLGPNYCAGSCPTGAACAPTAIAIPRPDQSLCRYGCETIVDYTCICGC